MRYFCRVERTVLFFGLFVFFLSHKGFSWGMSVKPGLSPGFLCYSMIVAVLFFGLKSAQRLVSKNQILLKFLSSLGISHKASLA